MGIPAKLITLWITLGLLWTAPLSAGPITVGVWVPTRIPDLETDKSEDDCGNPGKCAAIWLLPPGTERLTAGFGYADWPGALLISQQTDYTDAPGLAWAADSFTYDNGHGFTSSSWAGFHQQLYRQDLVGLTRYWLAIEDLPAPIVPDWNDALFTWEERRPVPPTPIPEPASLFLLGAGLIGWRFNRHVHTATGPGGG